MRKNAPTDAACIGAHGRNLSQCGFQKTFANTLGHYIISLLQKTSLRQRERIKRLLPNSRRAHYAKGGRELSFRVNWFELEKFIGSAI